MALFTRKAQVQQETPEARKARILSNVSTVYRQIDAHPDMTERELRKFAASFDIPMYLWSEKIMPYYYGSNTQVGRTR